jgi:UDP-N-acetylmuramoyl-tripeptide--D-alanyl-D-alanine ligase
VNIYYSLLKISHRLLGKGTITSKDIRIKLAFKKRKKLNNSNFIAITGSSGKSTTTTIIAHLLSECCNVTLSWDANTILSFPKAVLNMDPKSQYGVFEVSGHEPGAIDDACQLLKPSIGVITTVSSDHRASFRNLENTAKEKGLLAEVIPKEGLVFLNSDDPLVFAMRHRARANVVTFGTNENAQFRATDIETTPSGDLRFACHYEGESCLFEFKLLGLHFVTSALGGIAVAHKQGMTLQEIARRANSYQGLLGRCSIHHGSDGTIYVCDTVKSPYSTVELAFEVTKIFTQTPRKTIVIGSISDKTGTDRSRYKLPIIKALDLADRVILFGNAALRAKVDAADIESGRIFIVEKITDLNNLINNNRIPGEMIFLKGSALVDHLERIALEAEKPIDCWLEKCKKYEYCFSCSDLRKNEQ